MNASNSEFTAWEVTAEIPSLSPFQPEKAELALIVGLDNIEGVETPAAILIEGFHHLDSGVTEGFTIGIEYSAGNSAAAS
jgi:hypothetical protein